MNYFELYPGDYMRDTGRLTLVEHGAYLRLLLAYYAEEAPLPGDYDELYQIACAIRASEKAAVRKISDRFFPLESDGFRHNKRCDQEIAKAQPRMAASRANGRNGGRPRKTQQVLETGFPETQQGTHRGEASPRATRHTPEAVDTYQRADTTSGAETLARALSEMGWQCTAGSPDVQRAADAGVTASGIRDAAAGCAGKPLRYVVVRAIGRLTDAATLPAAIPAAQVDPAAAAAAEWRRQLDDQVIAARHYHRIEPDPDRQAEYLAQIRRLTEALEAGYPGRREAAT